MMYEFPMITTYGRPSSNVLYILGVLLIMSIQTAIKKKTLVEARVCVGKIELTFSYIFYF